MKFSHEDFISSVCKLVERSLVNILFQNHSRAKVRTPARPGMKLCIDHSHAARRLCCKRTLSQQIVCLSIYLFYLFSYLFIYLFSVLEVLRGWQSEIKRLLVNLHFKAGIFPSDLVQSLLEIFALLNSFKMVWQIPQEPFFIDFTFRSGQNVLLEILQENATMKRTQGKENEMWYRKGKRQ